jgi:histone acetyltransferase MYST1
MSERRDGRSRKRKRHTSTSSGLGSHSDETPPPHEEDVPLTEEELDLQQHKQITAQRNFETVHFGNWQIKTWYVCLDLSFVCSVVQSAARYFSPYPLTDEEETYQPLAGTGPRIPGVARTTARSHGRTVDILAGGLHRYHSDGHRADLYVCDMCFKYMADPVSWELHKVRISHWEVRR